MAEFIYESLTPNEKVYSLHHPNWKSQIGFFLLGFATIYYGVGVILLFIGLANYALIEVAFTDERIIARSSKPFSKLIELPLNEIAYLHYKQSYWGSKFNYGTVLICTMNGTTKKFKYISDPKGFCSNVNAKLMPS